MKRSALVLLTGLSVLWASPALAQEMSPMEWGIDRFGGDFSSLTTARLDPTLCQNECAASSQCVAWSYVPGALACFLKDTVPVAEANDSVVSGVKSEPAR